MRPAVNWTDWRRYGMVGNSVCDCCPAAVSHRRTAADQVLHNSRRALASDRFDCIVPDSRGFIWFCTPEGLTRFGGYRMVSFGTGDGLPHREIEALLETRSGAYLVGTRRKATGSSIHISYQMPIPMGASVAPPASLCRARNRLSRSRKRSATQFERELTTAFQQARILPEEYYRYLFLTV